jgi:DNA-binding LacI/PurR family transcriptional regulator
MYFLPRSFEKWRPIDGKSICLSSKSLDTKSHMPRRKQATTSSAPSKVEPPADKSAFLHGRPISLRVLGDYLDLSPATISLVLNNAPGVRSIPQETRERVLAAAQKFDYRPSFYARSLRRKQSFSVGVLVPELSDGYSVLVMDGIEEVLMEEGYFYLAASHRRKADLIEEYPRLLMDRSVEGFIAIDTALQHSLPIPVVAVAGHRQIEGVTNIALDHRRAAELAMRHLYQLGHRHIAFMRGQTFSSDSDDRWKSFMAVARELGIEVSPELVVRLELNISSPELGYPVARHLLAQKRSPSTTSLRSGRFVPFATRICACPRTCLSSDSTTFKAPLTTTPASRRFASLCESWGRRQRAYSCSGSAIRRMTPAT